MQQQHSLEKVSFKVPCTMEFVQVLCGTLKGYVEDFVGDSKGIYEFQSTIREAILDVIFESRQIIEEEILELKIHKTNKSLKVILYKEENKLKEFEHELMFKQEELKSEETNEYKIRNMRDYEAVYISKCAYESYGDTYAYKEIYCPDTLKKLNKNKELISYVAVNKDEEIMSHAALKIYQNQGEMLAAFTKPKYRGVKCISKISEKLIEEAKNKELETVFVSAVSTHVYSQRAARSLNMSETALKLSAVKALYFKKLAKLNNKRENLFINHMYLKKPFNLKLNMPIRHQNIIKKTYENLGVKVENNLNAELNLNEKSKISIELNKNNSCKIEIKQFGKDIVSSIKTKIDLMKNRSISAFYVYMDLKDENTAHMVEKFEKEGLYYCGIEPSCEKNYLILQYVTDDVCYKEINPGTEFASEIFEYIKVERERGTKYEINRQIV